MYPVLVAGSILIAQSVLVCHIGTIVHTQTIRGHVSLATFGLGPLL
jgi:hypothetical protein